MTKVPAWHFNEMKFSGVDFTQGEEVAAYDAMHRKLRDYARVSEEIIRLLSLNPGSTFSIRQTIYFWRFKKILIYIYALIETKT